MDNRLRRNEKCVIGLPRCDFVFASSRSCFIAYGFTTSALEMHILRSLLEKRGIQPVEAGGTRAPGESAFCTKICSKIITSQFCVALVNNDQVEGKEVPNANVYMEYGLMLGFNKCVIPFQRAEQRLPFNVAGLDTIKYTNENFATLAGQAIDQAVSETTPAGSAPVDTSQQIQTFLLTRDAVFARVEADGDKAIFDLGISLGFNLLITFEGTQYIYLGNFTHLRAEAAIWRLRMLCRAIDGRRASFPARVGFGLMTQEQAETVDKVFAGFKIWLIVTSEADRKAILESLRAGPITYETEVFALTDIERELQSLGGALA